MIRINSSVRDYPTMMAEDTTPNINSLLLEPKDSNQGTPLQKDSNRVNKQQKTILCLGIVLSIEIQKRYDNLNRDFGK